MAERVVAWQRRSGRHGLPWQHTQDPYKVWLSEIMLQQTQVVTVIDYFQRFVAQFPTVAALAQATQQEVLGLWSGLGYYSRARNLHKAAQTIMQVHGGRFPKTAQLLETLPGIGRSTAAAIASVCFGERVAILDGNVKRVLTRYLGFDHDLASVRHERALWALAQELLPARDVTRAMPVYTQGMMDLGAMVCTSKQPQCEACPLSHDCVAYAQGDVTRYPVKTRKLKRSTQSLWLLWVENARGEVLLAQRAQQGVWAGLYVLPWFESMDALEEAVAPVWHDQWHEAPVIKHILTHRDVYLHPVRLRLTAKAQWALQVTAYVQAQGLDQAQWMGPAQWVKAGLPAPVRQLLSA
jgi:A/G-specific adenine glycosylase